MVELLCPAFGFENKGDTSQGPSVDYPQMYHFEMANALAWMYTTLVVCQRGKSLLSTWSSTSAGRYGQGIQKVTRLSSRFGQGALHSVMGGGRFIPVRRYTNCTPFECVV